MKVITSSLFWLLPVLLKSVSILAVSLPPLPFAPSCSQQTATVTVTANNPVATGTDQCNTGPVQCCTNSQNSSGEVAAPLLGFLGVALNDLDPLVGIGCSPVSVVGGSTACSATPLCCENNTFNGIIAVGCVVVNIYL